MPSDSIAGFLDEARANRVLFPEQVDQLIRRPDIPHANLGALCAYLEERGTLTRFQADALRSGRGGDLNFAGYPVLDEAGPCPGGVAYRALHPAFRTPVALRRFRAADLAPTDTPEALVGRARAATAVHHPNLVTPLDAGEHGGEWYAAYDLPADAAPLDALVVDIGPVPAFLAAEYGRQAAAALHAAHGRGLWHGDVRPANLIVGPMTTRIAADGTTRQRPAPNAAVRLLELGLVPVRPPASVTPPADDVLPYLPPERLDAGQYDPRGDLFGLGATLYYLLTGHAPFSGATPDEVLHNVRTAAPASLAALRPDLPAELAELVHRLLSKRPDERPKTALDVERALVPFCRPGTVPAPVEEARIELPPALGIPDGDPHPTPTPAPAEEWGAGGFSTAHAEAGPVRRRLSAQDKGRAWRLVALGSCLHLCATAVGVYIAAQAGCFGPDYVPGGPAVKEPDRPAKPPAKAKPKADPRPAPGDRE